MFDIQLEGGTDIRRALNYCHGLMARPTDIMLVLISDLLGRADKDKLLNRLPPSLVPVSNWSFS